MIIITIYKEEDYLEKVFKVCRMADGTKDRCCIASLDGNLETLEEVGGGFDLSSDLSETAAQLPQELRGSRPDGT